MNDAPFKTKQNFDVTFVKGKCGKLFLLEEFIVCDTVSFIFFALTDRQNTRELHQSPLLWVLKIFHKPYLELSSQ